MATIYGSLDEDFDIRKIATVIVGVVFIIMEVSAEKSPVDRKPMNESGHIF